MAYAPASLLLALETATPICSVALIGPAGLLAEANVHTPRAHGRLLPVLVRDAMAWAEADWSHIGAVAVSAGPGSYTGLRVGASAAKGFCLASGAALIPVGTLDALIWDAQRLLADDDFRRTIGAVLPSRRGEVYVGIAAPGFDALADAVAAEPLDIADADTRLGNDDHLAVGPGGSVLSGGTEWIPVDASARALGAVGWARWKAGNAADLADFEPDYLKPFVPTQPKLRPTA